MPPEIRPSQSKLARSFELWWQFTLRAVEMRHRGSYLGILWTVINPLMALALYTTVFGFIYKSQFHVLANETPLDFVLAVFMGLILFHILAETIATAPTYIVGNPNLVKKVVFPLEVLPVANISALWFNFLVSFILLLIAALCMERTPPVTGLLWMPLILVPHVLFSLGLGWIFAALGVFFRDIAQVAGFAAQVILYASAVFYPVQRITDVPWLWNILKWNPLLQTVELSRQALLWHQPLNLSHLLYTWCAGLATAAAGFWFFKKIQPAFADVI